MNEEPDRSENDQPEDVPATSTGAGCFRGGLATVLALILGGILSAVLLDAIGQTDIYSPVAATIATLIPLALLAASGYYWRKEPGFLLGIGLTVAIVAVVGTACGVMIRNSFG